MPIDYSRYPPNWKKEIVPAILKRADNKCERCGLYNKSTVYAVYFWIKDIDGRYKRKSIWFQNLGDALRESGGTPSKGLIGNPQIRAVKVVLTVAHLDHDETNHDVSLDRLQSLCQQCHLRYDAKEKYRRQLNNWKPNTPTIKQ